MDNYAAHKHSAVKAWLEANPRVQVHFTPTHASWMNMVEISFSMAERQAIHRGAYRSVRDLTQAIRAYIDGWNDRAHPFTWSKPPSRSSPRPSVKSLQTGALDRLLCR